MKKLYIFIVSLFSFASLLAQNVGIGTTTPNASALLELQSTNKGLLLPRVADTNAVPSPAKGLLIFANATNSTWFYDGTKWQSASTDGLWSKYQDSIAVSQKKYIGINTDYNLYPPKQGIQANGSLLIHQELAYTNTAPTVAQTHTMNNLPSFYTSILTDSTLRVFDPGGANNPYFNNGQGNVIFQSTGGVQLSFNAADFGIGAGDTLWISESSFPNCRTNYEQRFTNTTQAPTIINVNSTSGAVYLIFRSNGDNNNSNGFDITCKGLYPKNTNESSTNIVGNALQFNGANGSLSAGNGNTANGVSSIAMGRFTTASGFVSTAMGSSTTASGNFSTAMGSNTTAGGNYSTAMGRLTTASGTTSTAIGENTTASGTASTAMGRSTTASGFFSTSIGENTTAIGTTSTAMGSFTTAGGNYSTAMGEYTTASGNNSTAMGRSTTASGNNSTAMGIFTTASGVISTAMGNETNSRAFSSLAIGSNNDSIASSNPTNWVNTDPLLYIGNSRFGSPRSNAMVVYKNANVDINGYTRLGKISEDAPIIKMKKLLIPVGPAVDGLQSYPMGSGITDAKVLGVQIFVTYADPAPFKIPASYRDAAGYEFNYQVQANNIVIINKAGNSANIGAQPFTVLITYEE